MSSDHSERSRAYMYRNESKEEMLAFTGAYLMAACMKNTVACGQRMAPWNG